jgi:hypothetical protein
MVPRAVEGLMVESAWRAALATVDFRGISLSCGRHTTLIESRELP